MIYALDLGSALTGLRVICVFKGSIPPFNENLPNKLLKEILTEGKLH